MSKRGMSRRHQLELRLNAYAEVRAILSAMRNVALVELRKLGGQLEHQRRAMSTIERAAGDVMRFYAPPGPAPQQASGQTHRSRCGRRTKGCSTPSAIS